MINELVNTLQGTKDVPYTTDPAIGLDFLINQDIRYMQKDRHRPDRWIAWSTKDPKTIYEASNGLLAGCKCYLFTTINKQG